MIDLPLATQVVVLLLLGVVVACVAWTVTHEEVFREPREYCQAKADNCRHWWQRKFFYLFTCEYCFSHYVSLGVLALTGYRLLLADWRGVVLALFALVWVANQYMSIYARLRVELKKERLEAREVEQRVEEGERD
ncbi:MAG TPA: hypothetical protein VG817_08035 [Gemmatimonadales bacterium]|nr:hypothetical protein [Gemmatimonadales bacterium]